ncbi:hypothetical protein [Halobacillus karajensis]|uniref:Uncharacterized protein n=1 Tax=Halobacillus karajensis TaxID=195088 RepID=A0A059NUY4_9BACI|nr:hypothetical protein [Halobacillus karajensis]CDQ22604.1 hypothetical protein BN983_00817 [Halobacillus karajensis]CDQ26086.1 hypothetical protein BN981_00297 [Halobacillus karajensis]
MNSTLPYSNRLKYLIGVKTGSNPEALTRDIEYALRDYAAEVHATTLKERDEWKDYAMRRM